jgi:hypothetical protein
MKIIGNQAIFTKEEEERIDRLLAEADEEQKRNGNKYYTDEEVWKPILGEKLYNQLIEEEKWGKNRRVVL